MTIEKRPLVSRTDVPLETIAELTASLTEPDVTVAGFEISRRIPRIDTAVPKGAVAGDGKPEDSMIAVMSPMWRTVGSREPLAFVVEAAPAGISVPPAEI